MASYAVVENGFVKRTKSNMVASIADIVKNHKE